MKTAILVGLIVVALCATDGLAKRGGKDKGDKSKGKGLEKQLSKVTKRLVLLLERLSPKQLESFMLQLKENLIWPFTTPAPIEAAAETTAAATDAGAAETTATPTDAAGAAETTVTPTDAAGAAETTATPTDAAGAADTTDAATDAVTTPDSVDAGPAVTN